MTSYLANKRILLGITGSIAAYKSADLVRRLRDAGAIVRVAMTENAKRFITPLTMQAVSGYPVHDDLFDLRAEAAMGHIELARWADMILIAPASADLIARLAMAQANDLLTTLCLATAVPIAIAPAMNQGMWRAQMTQQHVQSLQKNKTMIWGPAQGSQACGDVGPGRMLEPAEIVHKIHEYFSTGELAGRRVLITAGPTHEAIDPVRFISNGSSGKMGYALAEAAREAGAVVTLVSGPVHLPKPSRMEVIEVVTAQEMYEAVMKEITETDIFLAVAAVSDYRCQTIAKQKMHKENELLQLTFERNPDIVSAVATLPNKPFVVGFAAETENVIEQARAKYQRKKMDMMIANQVGEGKGIGCDDNEVTVISAHHQLTLPLTHKHQLARKLINLIANEFKLREKKHD